MRNIYFVFIAFAIYMNATGQTAKSAATEKNSVDKIICISGGLSNDSKAFIKYIAALTRKPNPKICFVPTASADNSYGDYHLV
jgi:hypothetical protein